MKRFYLNLDFFKSHLKCAIPLGKDFYLYIESYKSVPQGYKVLHQFSIVFEVKVEDEFIETFHALLDIRLRSIVMHHCTYILDPDLAKSKFTYFPLTYIWFVPCTRFDVFLRHCYAALSTYRSEDWI